MTAGKVGGHVDGMSCILLRTIGRRSGKPHTVCLSYLPDGDSMVIVGSFGGAEHHPAWYHNLRANPEVIVQRREQVFSATAETLTGDEREALWETRIAGASRYARYQQRTDREIPLVRLSYPTLTGRDPATASPGRRGSRVRGRNRRPRQVSGLWSLVSDVTGPVRDQEANRLGDSDLGNNATSQTQKTLGSRHTDHLR